jgi:hypothetical protein
MTATMRWPRHFFTHIIMRRETDLEEKHARRMLLTRGPNEEEDQMLRLLFR